MQDPVLYLTKKLNSSEVNLKNVSAQDLVLFNRAKSKEVTSFLRNSAVRRCLDDDEAREAFGSGRILKARCVLTWKPVTPDERQEAAQDQLNNPNTVVNHDATRKAKARIVLLCLASSIQACLSATSKRLPRSSLHWDAI